MNVTENVTSLMDVLPQCFIRLSAFDCHFPRLMIAAIRSDAPLLDLVLYSITLCGRNNVARCSKTILKLFEPLAEAIFWVQNPFNGRTTYPIYLLFLAVFVG